MTHEAFSGDPTLERRLAAWIASTWPEDLDPSAQRRLIALSRRVAFERGDAGIPVEGTELEGLPEAWIERAGDGTVLGASGVSRSRSPHTLDLDGTIRSAWCALDVLFLPAVLGVAVESHSTCPETGDEIRLRTTVEGVVRRAPQNAVLCLVTPSASAVRADPRGAFCRHVRFLAGESAAARWCERDGDRVAVSLDAGFRLGAVRNRTVLGAALGLAG